MPANDDDDLLAQLREASGLSADGTAPAPVTAREHPRDRVRRLATEQSAGNADFVDHVMRTAYHESRFREDARSKAGATGTMQIMPGTFRDMGGKDYNDPAERDAMGVKYALQQWHAYGGDRALAAAAYNAGPGAVRRYGGVPPYAETQDYVRKVAGDAALPDGDAPARRPRRLRDAPPAATGPGANLPDDATLLALAAATEQPAITPAAGDAGPKPKPKSRPAWAVANDLVIEGVNAAAGGVKAMSDFVSPGNRVSEALDSFIKSGQDQQSDVAKDARAKLAADIAAADGIGDEIKAVGRHVVDAPLLTAAQVFGNILPVAGGIGMLSKAARGASLAANAGKGLTAAELAAQAAAAGTRAGTAGGMAIGAAMGGGDAAGSAYEKIMAMPDDVILASPEGSEMVRRDPRLTAAQIREHLATKEARIASIGPAALGAATGAIGVERILAGAKGAGRVKTALIEGGSEAVEEGVTSYSGSKGAANVNPAIDPTKGVAADAAMGAVMGGVTGAALGHRVPEKGPLSRGANVGLEQAETQAGVEAGMRAATPLLGNEPETLVAFPDGTMGTRRELDAWLAGLPERERMEAMARLTGVNPSAGAPPAVPAPAAGPVDTSVDTSAGPATQQSPAGQRPPGSLANPPMPPAAPSAPEATEQTQAERLQARLAYVHQQARNLGGWNAMLVDERRRVEAALQHMGAPLAPPAAPPVAPAPEAVPQPQQSAPPQPGENPAHEQAQERQPVASGLAAPVQQPDAASVRRNDPPGPARAGAATSGEPGRVPGDEPDSAAGTLRDSQRADAVAPAGPVPPAAINEAPSAPSEVADEAGRSSAVQAPEPSPAGARLAPATDGVPPGAGEGQAGAPAQAPEAVGAAPVDVAAHEAATSPLNDTPEPSTEQKKAGNYKVGRIKVDGLDISVENPAGSARSGTSPDGTSWRNVMAGHYGYLRRTEGADGDHLDVFVKEGTPEDHAGPAWIVDQKNADGSFDEHKIVLGAADEADARRIYLNSYDAGWPGLGAITRMERDEFRQWVRSGDTKKPLAYEPPKSKAARAEPAAPANVPVDPKAPDAAAQQSAPRPVSAPVPESQDGKLADAPSAATAPTYTIADTPSGKGIVVKAARNDARVSVLPGGSYNSAQGGFLFSKKREVDVRAALAGPAEPGAATPAAVEPAPQDSAQAAPQAKAPAEPKPANTARKRTNKAPEPPAFKVGDAVEFTWKGLAAPPGVVLEHMPESNQYRIRNSAGAFVVRGSDVRAPEQAPETSAKTEAAQPPRDQNAAEARATVEEGGTPGEFIVRDGTTNLARFRLNATGKPVAVKFFYDSTASRDIAQAGIDRFVAERLRTQATADAPKTAAPKANPKPRPANRRAAARAKDPFRYFLGEHGVNIRHQREITGESGRKTNPMIPLHGPMFRQNGAPLDELARFAVDEGFLTPGDIDAADDTGGTRKLAGMIERAVNGERVLTVKDAESRAEQEANEAGRIEHEDALREQLRSVGLDATGTIEQMQARIDEQYEDALAALVNNLLEDDGVQQAIEEIDPDARPDDYEVDARILLARDINADAVEDAATYAEDDLDYFRRIEEIIRAVPLDARPARGSQAPAREPGRQEGDRQGQIASRGDDGEAEAFDLAAQTADDLRAQDAARKQAEAQREAAERRNAAPDAGEFLLTGSDSTAHRAIAAGQIELDAAPAEPKPANTARKRTNKATERTEQQPGGEAPARLHEAPAGYVLDEEAFQRHALARGDRPIGQTNVGQDIAGLLGQASYEQARKHFDAAGTYTGRKYRAVITRSRGGVRLFDDLADAKSFVDNFGRRTEGGPADTSAARSRAFQREQAQRARDEQAQPAQAAESAPQAAEGDGAPSASEPVQPVADAKPDLFAKNTLFTADKVEAARARLRDKLNRLNSGIDPEIMQDGLTLAGAYIEAGVRKFADFTAAMVGDLGDAVRPFLRSFYESARHYPGLDTEGMTPGAEIDAAAAKAEKPAEPVEKPVKAPKPEAPAKGAARTLRADWGTSQIDGEASTAEFPGEGSDYGLVGGVKDAFLKDARNYLKAVADQLVAEGFEPYQDKKGRPEKVVSVSEAGPAVSGDASLSMFNPALQRGIYVQIGTHGMMPFTSGPNHPQRVSILARVTYPNDRYGSDTNRWLPVDTTAGALASKMADEARSTSRNSGPESKPATEKSATQPAVAPQQDAPSTPEQSTIEPKEDGGNASDPGTDAQGTSARGQDPARGEPADLGGAPRADAGLLEGAPAGDVGAAGKAGRSRRPGNVPAGQDVRGRDAVPQRGNGADGRARAGRAGVADARAGSRSDGGRVDGAVSAQPDATPARASRPNFHIEDPEALVGGTPKVRFARNREALEAYRRVTEEGRDPTADELTAIARYIGWGSFGQELFKGTWERPQTKDGWAAEDKWLREHLGREEWESAQRSIINAHYTDPPTVGAIWSMVRRMGFAGGRVLEPSLGIGNFFGLMPRDLAERSQLAGIELDTLTAGMAKILYPQANIQHKGYQDSQTADGFYDLAIGNWPFAKDGPSDRRYNHLSPSLHDYFFLKALDQVREGGLVVGITSAGTLDKVGKSVRLALAAKADLVAAFRLPSGAFEKYAGTSVVTDIIVLRKRAAGEAPSATAWAEAIEVDTPAGERVRVNEYFAANPGNVLGTLNWGHGTTSGRPGMIVDRPADLLSRLEGLPARLPEAIYSPRAKRDHINYRDNQTRARERSVAVVDGSLFQVRGDHLAPLHEVLKYRVKSEKETAAREAQFVALADLAQRYETLIRAERDAADNAEQRRTELRAAYEAFQAAHGRINASYALGALRTINDPNFPLLAALERNTGSKRAPAWTPSRILTESTVRPTRKIDTPSVADALVMARNKSMDLDLGEIARAAGRPEAEVARELVSAGAIFQTPAGNYEVADQYLAGNVRRKLREAQEAAAAGMDMAGNIAALEKVVPKTIPYFNIEAQLGASWVPVERYRDFAAELLGTEPGNIEIVNRLGVWKVTLADGLAQKAEATTVHGHASYPFGKLLAAAMNNVAPKVWTRDHDGNKVLDEQNTKEAAEKASQLREKFGDWIWKDATRTVELERVYNEVMNAIASPKFDGSFLTLEGMALNRGDSPFSLRKHQVDAIYQALVNRRSMNFHEVGTGKTYTMAGIAIESRRYGLARKPLLFAHNANSASVAAEAQEMYPGARILYLDNLSPDTIDVSMRQIANDDWDLVVVPHSLIDRFGLKRETLMELAAEEIAALEQEAIDAAAEDGIELTGADMNDEAAMKKVRNATAKQLVHARNAIIKRIDDMAARASREGAVPFEDLGVDSILVDEAHVFKKPAIATRMRLKGLNVNPSAQSLAMDLLTGYVKRQNGGTGIHTFTGTPITNALNEIYNQQRYVMDADMERDGLRSWDGWFNAFASATTDVELTPTGEYEAVTRLASFVNTAELRRMIGQFTSVVFADDMPEFKPRETSTGKTLTDPSLTAAERDELVNGRSENPQGRPYKKTVSDVAEMSPAQRSAFEILRSRAQVFKKASKKERREIMLSGGPESPVRVETDAANAGLDARLYDMDATDAPDNKVNRAVRNLLRHYQEHPQSTQAVFMERGFSDSAEVSAGMKDAAGKTIKKKVARFNLAKDIVAKLVAGGIPAEQIAIVDGSTPKAKRKEIADAMNRAEVRVVIGNSQTLGVGVNMQVNLRAMHHLDAPWMPGDLEQRNGRGHRQGNKWNTVMEYRYLTERIDGRRWQVLVVKDRFIKSFLKADENTRVIEGDAASIGEGEDLSETLSDAAGDPRILLRNKFKSDVERLENKERLHVYAVEDARQAIQRNQEEAQRFTKHAEGAADDAAEVDRLRQSEFSIRIGDKVYTERAEADEALKAAAQALRPSAAEQTLGQYGGFKIRAFLGSERAAAQWYLQRSGQYTVNPSVASIEGKLRGVRKTAEDFAAKAAERLSSIPRLEEASRAPFARAADLEKKRALFADVEADLANNPEPAPAWLRHGAPIGAEVHVDGTPAIVEGHRYRAAPAPDKPAQYSVVVSGESGSRDVPYTEVMDASGTPLYEARETTPDSAGTPKFSRAAPTDFVQAPDGSIDFGQITPDVARAIGRQAGVIRLRPGDAAAGLAHIEAQHGEQIREAGYQSVGEFVRAVSQRFDAIYRRSGRALSLVRADRRGMLVIQLEPSESGDFYDVRTATIVRSDQFKNREPLWKRAGPSTPTAETVPVNPSGQSDSLSSVPTAAVTDNVQSMASGSATQSLQDGSEPASAVAGQRPAFAVEPEDVSSRGDPTARGQSKDSVGAMREAGKTGVASDALRATLRRRFGQTFARAERTGLVRIVERADQLPESVQRAAGKGGTVRGVYDGSTVWLVAENLPADVAAGVLLHELGEHAGLQAMLGDKYANLAAQFDRLVKVGDRDAVAADDHVRSLLEAGDMRPEDAASERLAYLVQHHEGVRGRSLVQKVVAAVRAWLHAKTGLNFDLTAADVHALAQLAARDAVARSARTQSSNVGGERFARASSTASEAFRRWFGDSKVVNADGQPLVVYHGSTNPDIDAFRAPSFFTPSKQGAEYYHHGEDGAKTYAVYLNITRPLDTTDKAGSQQLVKIARDAGVEVEMQEFADGSWSFEAPQIADHSEYDGTNLLDLVYIPAVRDELAKLGYDGIKGSDTLEADEIPVWIALKPEQIKSATGNTGSFDAANADIRFSRAGDRFDEAIRQMTVQNVARHAGNRLKDFRSIALAALGRRQLTDIYRDDIPELTRYNELAQQMDADKNEAGAEADNLARRWGKLPDERALAEVMHDATLAHIDPDKPIDKGADPAEYRALRAQFDALSEPAKDVYRQARDTYEAHFQEVRAAIRAKIERSMPASPKRAEMIERMDAEFFSRTKGVYFPLARFGEYVIVVRDAAGGKAAVSFAETLNEAEATRRDLARRFPASRGFTVGKVLKKREFNAARDAAGRGFMADLFDVLDKQGADPAISDAINQLYLTSLPDLSWAKHGIHRKGTPGFSQDARRAFASNVFHGANYLAKLRYADQLADSLTRMQEHVDARAEDADFDPVAAQNVVDEMHKRHDAFMNPKTNALSQALTSIGFVFHLGLSPASAMVNLMQTPLVAYPILGAKFGFGKSAAALAEASRLTAGNRNDLGAILTGDEKRAFDEAVRSGVIDVTLAHDLAGIASGSEAKLQGKLAPVMRAASFMFHHAEKFNRQATLLAAYRLAREAGQDHEAAYRSAVEDTYAGHFDYSAGNRARIMQGNVARVVLLFKQFATNMIYTLARQGYLAAQGDRQALKTFSGLLVTHALGAGLLGLPLVTTLLSAASMLGSDDDEPWDAQVALRNALADVLGAKPAEVLVHGLSRLTPWDISGRVGLDKLLLPDVQEGLEGQRLAEAWSTAALGPVAGIGVNVLKGLGELADGNVQRGLEAMLPAAIRGPAKALRLHEEGAKDRTGVQIVDEVTGAEAAGQFFGFSPSRVREATEAKSAVYNAERRLNERRSELTGQYARAAMVRDADAIAEARAEIRQWNLAHPNRRIDGSQLAASVRARNRRIAQAEHGVYLSRKHRDVAEEGRFAGQ